MIMFLLGIIIAIAVFALACAIIPVVFGVIGMVLQFIWAIFTGDVR